VTVAHMQPLRHLGSVSPIFAGPRRLARSPKLSAPLEQGGTPSTPRPDPQRSERHPLERSHSHTTPLKFEGARQGVRQLPLGADAAGL
jgi:hypothetical protein